MAKKKTAFKVYKKALGNQKGKGLTSKQLKLKYDRYRKQTEEQYPVMSYERWAKREATQTAEKERRYETYLREYEKAFQKAQRNGVEIGPRMSKNSFESYYEATRNEYIEQIQKGERKTVGAVTRDVAQAQIEWKFSPKQASSLSQYAKENEIDVSYKDIRSGNVKGEAMQELIKKTYKDLRDSGYSSKDAKLYISHAFFGSPTL